MQEMNFRVARAIASQLIAALRGKADAYYLSAERPDCCKVSEKRKTLLAR
jgi:hypothetical protein